MVATKKPYRAHGFGLSFNSLTSPQACLHLDRVPHMPTSERLSSTWLAWHPPSLSLSHRKSPGLRPPTPTPRCFCSSFGTLRPLGVLDHTPRLLSNPQQPHGGILQTLWTDHQDELLVVMVVVVVVVVVW